MTDFESYDGCTIYHGEPTDEIFLKWAYDDDLYLYDSYDEDIFLWDAKFVKFLMMVAVYDNCPKSDYALAVLIHFSRTTVLFGNIEISKKIWEEIKLSPYRKNKKILQWESYFETIYNRLITPKALSDSEVELLAKQLFDYEHKDDFSFERTGREIEGFCEYVRSYVEWNRYYLYINPKSGLWESSKYNPLKKLKKNTNRTIKG